MARRIRIRTSLLSMLLMLILLLASALLFVSYRAGQRIAEDLGDRYLGKTQELVEKELDSFFLPVMTALQNARVWARDGVVEPRDLEGSNKVYLPVLASYPQVTSIATGNVDGYSYRLGAKGENYLNRLTYAGVPGKPADYSIRKPDGTLIEAYSKATGFDPRKRPWYDGARKNLEAAGSAAEAAIAWTDPFILNTSKNPGIAASLPFEGPGNDIYMMTFNFMLTKLSNFTSSLRPSPAGMALVLTEEGRVVGFPATTTYDTPEKRLARIKELDNRMPEMDEVAAPALATSKPLWPEILGGASRHRIEVEGEPWRLEFRPYELEQGPPLWIGVAVPEGDFLGQVREQQRLIIWVSLAVLLIALGIALWLARTYSRPLRRLAEESARIERLDLAPGAPIDSHVLEVHSLAEAQENMRAALDSFSRYVPTAVVQQLLERGEAAQLGGRGLEISVMFTDIRGFTTISESMDPSALSNHLAEYFESMMTTIQNTGGTIDKMVGDAIMALWGAPIEHEDHAMRAVRGALACAAFVNDFNARCAAEGRPPLWTGFGLATGAAYVGNFGAPSRLNYTALGDIVNLSSRLEGATKIYGSTILASSATKQAVGDAVEWLEIDIVGVKGKTNPEPIFEPLGFAGEVASSIRADAVIYTDALAKYRARQFTESRATLKRIVEGSRLDPVARLLESRCMLFEDRPPDDDWAGVWWLQNK